MQYTISRKVEVSVPLYIYLYVYTLPSRPDMTFAVDWALKANYLSLYYIYNLTVRGLY